MTDRRLEGRSIEKGTPRLLPRGVLETALYVSDVRSAREWYERVLGLEATTFDPPRHVFFPLGASMLLLFNPQETCKVGSDAPPHGAHGRCHVAVETTHEDIERWRAHLQKEGVQVEKNVDWPHGGKSIYFRDPDGNSLELATRDTWKGLGLES